MAQTFTAIFQWIKKISLPKAVLPDSKDLNRSNCESPNSSTSIAESVSPAECILDTESNLRSQASSSPLSSARSQPRQEDIPNTNNPIAQLFQDQELGKTIIASVMPITTAFLSHAPASGLVRNLIFSSLALGLATLWNGILLRRVLPRQAITIEQIGAGLVLLAYYGLISSLLPDYLIWIPCCCFLMALIPFFWSYYLDRFTNE